MDLVHQATTPYWLTTGRVTQLPKLTDDASQVIAGPAESPLPAAE